jgi:tetratricopeptide (TPR) repeat protein
VALRDQAGRTAGEAGTRLLAEAVTAYRAALEIRTREQLPRQWAHTHRNLAQVHMDLGAWADAAASYMFVHVVYPDDDTVYQAAHVLYHERMFEFAHAFALTEQWLERHPEDHSALRNFAELHFTTGRFSDGEERLTALLATPIVEASSDIALRAIQIANVLALGKTDLVAGHLDALVARLVDQPEVFTVQWSFHGTKHVIRHHDQLSPYRPWLLQFFEALEGPDRRAILSGMQEARASAPPPVPR